MGKSYEKELDVEENLTISKRDFDVKSLDDEIRVDGLCRKVLKRFYLHLMEEGLSPEQATVLASSADYFLRDYLVGIRQFNPFDERPGIVRQFAGNWYIVSTLEPNVGELARHLEGIARFFRFLHDRGALSARYLAEMERECSDVEYYGARIDSFWAITGDGYRVWERECSLKED